MPDRPVDMRARILVDEVNGTLVSFAMRQEQADADPSFNPNVGRDPSLPYVPLAERMPATLATTEVFKFFDGKIQGEYRLMQIQPVGSGSPWVEAD